MIKFKDFKKVENTLFVDPGFNTGMVYWYKNKFKDFTISNKNTKAPLLVRIQSLINSIKDILDWHINVSKVVIEYQGYWEGSVRSSIAAKTGGLLGLTLLTGHYCQLFYSCGVEVDLIQPIKWKGNMDDKTVQTRIKKITNIDNLPNSHVRDAFGMSLHYMGVFSDDAK